MTLYGEWGSDLLYKEDSRTNPRNKKSLNFDHYSRRYQGVKSREKMNDCHKFKLIQGFKLKYNVIGCNIRRKTHNLI